MIAKLRLIALSGVITTIFTSCMTQSFIYQPSNIPLNFYYTYQTNTAQTGKAIFRPDRSTANTTITLNDSLIIDRKTVKSLTFENLPEGKYEIHYISKDNKYEDRLDEIINFEIKPGDLKHHSIKVPKTSRQYYQSHIFSLALTSITATYYIYTIGQ